MSEIAVGRSVAPVWNFIKVKICIKTDNSPSGAVNEVLVSLSLLARSKHFAAPPCRVSRALSGARYARSGAASRTPPRQGFRERERKRERERARENIIEGEKA